MALLEKFFGLKEVDNLASELLPHVKNARIVTFSGPLGAGKTTLIRALAQALGILTPVTSPTFAYLSTHQINDGQSLYHFDLYRLNSINSFYESGFDEYLYLPQSKVFIEWPEIITDILPAERLNIVLDYVESDSKKRLITVFE